MLLSFVMGRIFESGLLVPLGVSVVVHFLSFCVPLTLPRCPGVCLALERENSKEDGFFV